MPLFMSAADELQPLRAQKIAAEFTQARPSVARVMNTAVVAPSIRTCR